MNTLELSRAIAQQVNSRGCGEVMILTKAPQIYFENPDGMSNRQMRRHEKTRKRKGRP